ncbi:MAG: hypothetical protein JXX29_11140 [Deltaproteobacteria bacterium]|nr:hypothetical protein [Deltaproteobacteria bacterium]MBN2672225.1 hypothetical protein [Deltaproteobacteria bacterium]
MKKIVFVLSWLSIVTAAGCKENPYNPPNSQCPVWHDVDFYGAEVDTFDALDVLFVVDNSGSMSQEQEMLATSVFALVNAFLNPPPGWQFDRVDDLRIAFTTTDMGVSYDGQPYTADNFVWPTCVEGSGMGDNGAFQTAYVSETVNILENTIACGKDGTQCPPGWECGNFNAETGTGTCEDPVGDGSAQVCPPSPENVKMAYIDENWSSDSVAMTAACLSNVGTEGCPFEQQLAAGAAGLQFDPTFMREKSITAVIIVSDEEDGSLESDEWHTASEMGTNEVNLVYGRNQEYLTTVAKLKEKYDQLKNIVSGSTQGMMFAAIVGVPMVAACQGSGNQLAACLDEPLPEGGTVGDPEVVVRPDPNGNDAFYYEYACERFDTDGQPVTQAYAGARFVEMAQMYEEMGYVYSICNNDWTPAMEDIASIIAGMLKAPCFAKKLDWDPATATSECNLVYEYRFVKSEYPSAPTCDQIVADANWVDGQGVAAESQVRVGEQTVDYWIRSCLVPKIPVPLNCGDISTSQQSELIINLFGWTYCENAEEDNASACEDGIDNDLDGAIDAQDADCAGCASGAGLCDRSCPYNVTLSDTAIIAAMEASQVYLMCHNMVSDEDSPCLENSYHTCNDGVDNDGDGRFDCRTYLTAEEIPQSAFPETGPRYADPSCCPMVANQDNGRCEFVNAAGNPDTPAQSAWVANCRSEDFSAASMPDSCCESADALMCALPDEYQMECQMRHN